MEIGRCGGYSIHGESWDWNVSMELFDGGFSLHATLEVHKSCHPETQELVSVDDPEEAGWEVTSGYASGGRIPGDIRPTLRRLCANIFDGLDGCMDELEAEILRQLVEIGLLEEKAIR